MASTGISTPSAGELDASLLQTTLTSTPGVLPPSSSLVFGQTFSDHMLTVEWSAQHGFEAPHIKPYGPLSLDPSATVLHYAPTLFEGMKAYKDANGVARLFRESRAPACVDCRVAHCTRVRDSPLTLVRLTGPDKNMERMNRGAARLGFPVSSDVTGQGTTGG